MFSVIYRVNVTLSIEQPLFWALTNVNLIRKISYVCYLRAFLHSGSSTSKQRKFLIMTPSCKELNCYVFGSYCLPSYLQSNFVLNLSSQLYDYHKLVSACHVMTLMMMTMMMITKMINNDKYDNMIKMMMITIIILFANTGYVCQLKMKKKKKKTNSTSPNLYQQQRGFFYAPQN